MSEKIDATIITNGTQHAYSTEMNDSVDTKKLRMFVATVQAGSMRKASTSLHVTPSALSHGIKSLEESLGTKLFHRNGPVLSTTDAGMQFYNDAFDLLKRLETMVTRFVGPDPNGQIQLHIGTTNTGCRHLFPAIVREFRESFPDVALKLEIGETDQLVSQLSERRLDFVIAPIQRNYRELEQSDLGSDELVYIVHPSHLWALNHAVVPETVPDQKLIIPAMKSHTYSLIDSYFRKHRMPLEPFIELNNEEAIKQLVSLNIGIGIVPCWIAQEELQCGSLHAFRLGQESLMRRWTVAHLPNDKPEFPEFLFMEMTKAVSRNLLRSFNASPSPKGASGKLK